MSLTEFKYKLDSLPPEIFEEFNLSIKDLGALFLTSKTLMDLTMDTKIRGMVVYDDTLERVVHRLENIRLRLSVTPGLNLNIFSGAHTISLTGIKMTNKKIKTLMRNKALHTFEISWTSLKDSGLEIISKNKKIHTLDIANTAITDDGLESLVDSNITSLNLSCVNITNKGIVILSNIKMLHTLNLTGTEVTDVNVLSKSKFLHSLTLWGTKVNDVGISDLVTSTSLQLLDISYTDVTEAGVISILKNKSLCAISLVGIKMTRICIEAIREVDIRCY
jgi:hypothetical protein